MNKKQGIILLSIGISIIFGGCTNDKQMTPKESSTDTEISQTASSKSSKISEDVTEFVNADELLDRAKAEETYFIVCSPKNSIVEKYYQKMLPELSESIANNFYFIDSEEMKNSKFYKEYSLAMVAEDYDDGILIYIEKGAPKNIFSKQSGVEELSTKELEGLFK